MGVNRDFDVLYKEMSLRKHDLHPLALNWRAKGGKKYTKSSPNAHNALLKGQLSKFFWQRFEAKYDSLTKKRVGYTSEHMLALEKCLWITMIDWQMSLYKKES